MSDTTWKPKSASGASSGSSNSSVKKTHKVELSIQSSDTKKVLEEIIREKDEFAIKEGKDTTPASLLILELQDNPDETFSIIRDLTKTSRGTEIFLTSSKLDSAILLEAMRSGAKEFLAQPLQKQEIEAAFSRFQERVVTTPESPGTPTEGKVLAFFGGKGGVGTTCIAVNTAAALMNLPRKPRVVLVDVNQHGGDLPLYLDLQPSHSFRDIAADPSRLDQAFLVRVLTKHESGLQVLASGYDDLSTGRLSPDCVETTLRMLQANFDYIVLDCGHVLDLTTKKALELASLILVSSTLMVPVVHRTKRILDLLRGSGFPQKKIRLIMNRFLNGEKDVLLETEEILKQKSHWLVPNDYPSVSHSVNSGKPLIETAPKSSVGKSYIDLALSFEEQPNTAQSKSSLLGWLSPFKSKKTQAVT